MKWPILIIPRFFKTLVNLRRRPYFARSGGSLALAKVATVSRQTQSARILALLESKPEVSALELSSVSLQYCARVRELRKAGAIISNRIAVQRNGTRHGFYRLINRPFVEKPVNPEESEQRSPKTKSLFLASECLNYPD